MFLIVRLYCFHLPFRLRSAGREATSRVESPSAYVMKVISSRSVFSTARTCGHCWTRLAARSRSILSPRPLENARGGLQNLLSLPYCVCVAPTCHMAHVSLVALGVADTRSQTRDLQRSNADKPRAKAHRSVTPHITVRWRNSHPEYLDCHCLRSKPVTSFPQAQGHSLETNTTISTSIFFRQRKLTHIAVILQTIPTALRRAIRDRQDVRTRVPGLSHPSDGSVPGYRRCKLQITQEMSICTGTWHSTTALRKAKSVSVSASRHKAYLGNHKPSSGIRAAP